MVYAILPYNYMEGKYSLKKSIFKKKSLTFLLILLLVITTFCGCGNNSSQSTDEATQEIQIDDSLRLRIDSFICTLPPCGKLGIEVYDITAQKEVFTYNKDSLMIPASCTKLLTCIATLRYFGADRYFKNQLYTTGKISGDTLTGNLILRTQFDTFFNRDTLNSMLEELKSKGIKSIKGDVLIDMVFTEPMDHEEHWIIGDLRTRYMGLVLQGLPRMKSEFASALRMKGIKYENEIKLGKLPTKDAVLITENNNKIRRIVEKALKNSSNINAESLLYPLGYIIDTNGRYRENGIRLLKNFLTREININPELAGHFDDGCGLCPDNRMSPQLLVQLLIYAAQRPNIYKEILQAMPLAGIDGTLYNRMHTSDIQGKLRAKTGTLTRNGGVSTLAGYFIGKDKHLIAFAIMNNGCGVEDGRAWQDKFCAKSFKPTELLGDTSKTKKQALSTSSKNAKRENI